VHRFLSPWWRRRQVPPKRRFLQEPHGVTTQKTPSFIVTAVKTSNLTLCMVFTSWKPENKNTTGLVTSILPQVWKVCLYYSTNRSFETLIVILSALPDLVRSSGRGTSTTQPREDNWRVEEKPRWTAAGIRRADHTLSGKFGTIFAGCSGWSVRIVRLWTNSHGCKTWGFHGGYYEEWCLLGRYDVWLYKNKRFGGT
jgi:hypothetical protein